MGEARRKDAIQGEIVHEYDGIEEADNRLPRWWLATFYGTIVFAVGYWSVYEAYEMAPHQPEVFAAQLAERAAQGGSVDDATLEMLAQDGATVEQGRQVFATNCAACHGERAQGVIGPNLTDGAWLHGGSPVEIYTTVREGVTDRGMPAWGPTLGARPVQALTAYILSLRDTNVPGRPPEGEPYVPGDRGGQTDATEQADPPAASSTDARPPDQGA